MTSEELKKEILEKTAEYYRLVHKAKQAAEAAVKARETSDEN